MKLSIASTSLLVCVAAANNLRRNSNPNDTTNAVYKNPKASVEDRVEDLLWRMTIQEKTSQLVQGDISNWINMTDNTFNLTGLEWNMATRGGSFYVGYPVDQQWIANGIKIGQDYLMKNTTLGIPALAQSEGIHGFLVGKFHPFWKLFYGLLA
jgi:beta-glucosidase